LIHAHIAVINAFTSALPIIFWMLACSVLRILPLNGKIAWNSLLRHCFALPPAESPSTIYISVQFFPLLEQSDNFPGNTHHANTFFLRIVSLANLAASLALAASSIFSNILLNSSSLLVKNSLR
jgi:hypothetical protein